MDITVIDRPKEIPKALVLAASNRQGVERHRLASTLHRDDRRFLSEALASEGAFNERTARIFPLPSHPGKRILILGLPEREKWNRRRADVAVRRVVAALKEARVSRGTLSLADFAIPSEKPEETARRVAVNLVMADYAFTKYKEEPKEGWPRIDSIEIVVPRGTGIERLRRAVGEGRIIGEEVNHCRELANTPGGDMTPSKLADAALAEQSRIGKGFSVRVLDEADMEGLGMGGVLGVGKGSLERPRFIIIEFRNGPEHGKPLVFCGKGVTFDTGGLNLKPTEAISEMHMDMSGGAAVIHGIAAIARLGLPVNVVGLVPAVENMPSGSSYHPGDVLRTITGKTIEVLNTDAEGRIILADALGYAQRFHPQLIVDLATLTGAAMVALGQRAIALFTQDPKLEELGRMIGERSGDDVWPLPLWDDYLEDIRGTFGDVANTGKNRYGGAIMGAIFLREFVGDYPWMHLDIAPRMTTIEGEYLAKGAAGAGVRFLVELARTYAKGRR